MGQTPQHFQGYPQGYPQQPVHVVPAQPTNGLGLAGFIVSLVGFFLGCLLCPIGLVLSFFALFKKPRGFAIAGFILGLIGSIIPAVFLAIFGVMIFSVVTLGKPGFQTFFALEEAHQKVNRAAISGLDGGAGRDAYRQMLIGGMNDGWGHPLQYAPSAGGYEIRSAGPDGILNNSDDLTQDYREPATPKPE